MNDFNSEIRPDVSNLGQPRELPVAYVPTAEIVPEDDQPVDGSAEPAAEFEQSADVPEITATEETDADDESTAEGNSEVPQFRELGATASQAAVETSEITPSPADPDELPAGAVGTVEGYGAIAYEEHLEWLDKRLSVGRAPYPFNRRLEGENSYEEMLPAIAVRDAEGTPTGEEQNFVDVIDGLIAQRKTEAEDNGTAYEPPTVMDIGPGNFQALLDARDKWGDDVKLVGVGPDAFLDFDGTYGESHIGPTRTAVEAADITIINDSVTSFTRILPEDSKPDVVLSSHALQYTHTPLWETFASQVYENLNPGGYAFIAAAPPSISTGMSAFADTEDTQAGSYVMNAMNRRYQQNLGELDTYLQAQGYSFTVTTRGQLACQKVAVNGSFGLPPEIRTILKPTVAELSLEQTAALNNRVQYWCDNMTQRMPRSLSAYPVMHIPS